METISSQIEDRLYLSKEWLIKTTSIQGIIFRYVVAGGTAAIVDLGLLYIFTSYIGFHYLLSVVIAFAGAFLVSFTLQKFWTFRDHSIQNIHRQSIVYLVVSLGNFFLNTYLMYIFVEKINIHYLVAQVFVGGIIACLSFFLCKHFIFIQGKNKV
ncbi:MAG: GtrA family protein [Candidatus Yonathbacteria bacterium]|nr:GtrA family protein [Candidatus Yonathbacteria bacterium]